MRRSGFVDITRVAKGGICTLIVAMFLDANGDAEERPEVLFERGGRIVGEELCDAVGRGVGLESLSEKDVPDDGWRGFSDPARVDDLGQRETEDDVFVGDR